mmetsp:Transcript_4112/g.8391  ORF Transcript_4112/g.8391 Transcript_4112/m.8391 type:complete len:111 (-) Transcript_4112:102-434(-)
MSTAAVRRVQRKDDDTPTKGAICTHSHKQTNKQIKSGGQWPDASRRQMCRSNLSSFSRLLSASSLSEQAAQRDKGRKKSGGLRALLEGHLHAAVRPHFPPWPSKKVRSLL